MFVTIHVETICKTIIIAKMMLMTYTIDIAAACQSATKNSKYF